MYMCVHMHTHTHIHIHTQLTLVGDDLVTYVDVSIVL